MKRFFVYLISFTSIFYINFLLFSIGQSGSPTIFSIGEVIYLPVLLPLLIIAVSPQEYIFLDPLYISEEAYIALATLYVSVLNLYSIFLVDILFKFHKIAKILLGTLLFLVLVGILWVYGGMLYA